MKAIARARDWGVALNRLYSSGSFGVFPYEVDALLERGEFVPLSWPGVREEYAGPDRLSLVVYAYGPEALKSWVLAA